MKEGFEDAFSEVQSEIVSLCLEYAEGKAEKIFVYIYRTETMRMFNAFFKSEGKILAASQLPSTCSDDEFTDVGRNDISKIEEVCREYDAQIPNELKLYYDVTTHKFHAEISYEDYSVKGKVTPFEVFMAWLRKEKNDNK